jgi:hypothetical protein
VCLNLLSPLHSKALILYTTTPELNMCVGDGGGNGVGVGVGGGGSFATRVAVRGSHAVVVKG